MFVYQENNKRELYLFTPIILMKQGLWSQICDMKLKIDRSVDDNYF